MKKYKKRKLYAEQKNSLRNLQQKIGVSHNTLYKYADKQTKIEKMPLEMVLKIAFYEKIEPNILYKKMKEYLK